MLRKQVTTHRIMKISSYGVALTAFALCASGSSEASMALQAVGAPVGTSQLSSSLPPALSVGVSDEEFIGPFTNWADVKADYGAVGDGVADDTAAIQRGLDALRKYNSSSGPVTLYFPEGTYRITDSLSMELNSGANLIGATPNKTSIVWDGAAAGTMLLTSGSFDTLFTRLTWDGKNVAGIGVAQWWNHRVDGGNYQGGIKHVDEVFQNLGIGIYGGRLGADYGEGDSETLIERVKFVSNSIAGVNVGSFNALNWWIWDSQFTDCARGVSNNFSVDENGQTAGAGTFMIYRSVFQHSSIADMSIGNTGWFSLHNNVSIGSRQFIRAAQIGANGGPILVQNNTVIDTVDPVSIQVGNEGPLLLIDNQIRSRAGVTGPVVLLEGPGIKSTQSDRDVLSIGNRYTVSTPISIVGGGGRRLAVGDTMAGRSNMVAKVPALAGVAQNFRRRVFEVPPNATAEQIQAKIDAAVASKADNAVVHLPAGIYRIDRALLVPALARLQIAGDSESTMLWWSGRSPSGTMIRLVGPSYATIRDIALVGHQATAIEVSNADQVGGRVFIEGSKMAEMHVSGLTSSRVDAQANPGFAGLAVNASSSVLGIGGLTPTSVTANSNVLLADGWYEGDRADLFRGDSGNFTYLGGQLSPYSHGIKAGSSPALPSILVDNFSGQVSFIGGTLSLQSASNGIMVRSSNAATNAFFLGMTATKDGFFRSSVTDGAVGMVFTKTYTAGLGAADIPDSGRNDVAFILNGFRQARSVVWEATPMVHTPGATDVRIFRVFTDNCALGLSIEQ